MFRRLLIANRGEIACRIARSCSRLGIEYVAVYSDADAASLHLRGAAAAVRIGPPATAQSYLNQDKIIAAAREHRCDAIHPGYGFLSENAAFARAVRAAGISFVGPSAEVIEALGDKARAKTLMQAAGVPTVPGMASASLNLDELGSVAESIGYPLLLKPTAGGGGKGMQVVRDPAQFREAAAQAIRLADAHFGDGRLILERFVDEARHIEVQVFGDSHGNVVHLFERDCSLQRRHQKIVEEAPASGLADSVRAAMLDAAVRGAAAVRYDNAGTFEFIVDANGEFFFLEVNTRLQVEHPVTESITGLDLIEWQLRVACGEPLPLTQADIRASGHAIECRICAEDPANDFRPAPGKAMHVSWPSGARVDAGIAGGAEISPHYDALVAKLITVGRDRDEARGAMLAALRSTVLLGVTTNLGFLQNLMEDPNVVHGRYSTSYLDSAHFGAPGSVQAAVACACAATLAAQGTPRWPWNAGDPVGAFDRAWLVPDAPLGALWFWADRELYKGALVRQEGMLIEVTVGDQRFVVERDSDQGTVVCGRLGSMRWNAMRGPDAWEMLLGGTRYRLEAYADRNPARFSAGGSALSPMPGVVVAIRVAIGQRVREGDVLAIVEAMKMENRVVAPFDGTVKALNCRVDEAVDAGDLLVTVEPEE